VSDFRDLARNLAAGARLALPLPVRRSAFRIDVAQLVLVFVFSSLIDVAGDWVRYGPDAMFSWQGAGNELFSLGLLVAAACIVAWALRRSALALAIPVVVLAGAPLIQAADVALGAGLARLDIPEFALSWLSYVVPVWFVAMILRATWVALDRGGRRSPLAAVLGGALVATPVWLAPTLFPSMPWWQNESSVESSAASNPVSELVQAAQQQLLDDELGALEDERPGVVDLYFVAFAADARTPALHEEANRAQQVMDERWDTRGRSIVLANDPGAMLDTPFATVTHLRETLREIGAAIDAESDVVMVYVAGRAGGGGVEVRNAPLDLLPVTPSTLRALLDDAGIKWRIIIVSACGSEGFQQLADDATAVLTAGGSTECEGNAGTTPLGDALFARELAERDSFSGALEAAAKSIEAKGGKPQITIGSAIGETLKALDRGNAARRNGRTV
jgi:hypothetical protein